jgi:hypothetical protein
MIKIHYFNDDYNGTSKILHYYYKSIIHSNSFHPLCYDLFYIIFKSPFPIFESIYDNLGCLY